LAMSEETTERDLLEQIRDLLAIQLRNSGVATDTLARVLNISPKTVRNKYPLGREKEETE